ncbi:MAG: hypothetical protein WB565_00145 [Acidimicrobiales bacterium]
MSAAVHVGNVTVTPDDLAVDAAPFLYWLRAHLRRDAVQVPPHVEEWLELLVRVGAANGAPGRGKPSVTNDGFAGEQPEGLRAQPASEPAGSCEPPLWTSMKAAAEQLGVSRQRATELALDGRLHAEQVDGRWRVCVDSATARAKDKNATCQHERQ